MAKKPASTKNKLKPKKKSDLPDTMRGSPEGYDGTINDLLGKSPKKTPLAEMAEVERKSPIRNADVGKIDKLLSPYQKRESKNIDDIRDPKKAQKNDTLVTLSNNLNLDKSPISKQYKYKNPNRTIDIENNRQDELDYINSGYRTAQYYGNRTDSQKRRDANPQPMNPKMAKASKKAQYSFFKHTIKDN